MAGPKTHWSSLASQSRLPIPVAEPESSWRTSLQSFDPAGCAGWHPGGSDAAFLDEVADHLTTTEPAGFNAASTSRAQSAAMANRPVLRLRLLDDAIGLFGSSNTRRSPRGQRQEPCPARKRTAHDARTARATSVEVNRLRSTSTRRSSCSTPSSSMTRRQRMLATRRPPSPANCSPIWLARRPTTTNHQAIGVPAFRPQQPPRDRTPGERRWVVKRAGAGSRGDSEAGTRTDRGD